MTAELDFVIDQDDAWEPKDLPRGGVTMGGKTYEVQCPKDSLPMYLARVFRETKDEEDIEAQEQIIRDLLGALFTNDADVEEVMERVVDPRDPKFTVAFLVDTVRRVQQAYAPYLDEQMKEMGLDPKATAPATPKDHLPPQRQGARKAPARKKASAR